MLLPTVNTNRHAAELKITGLSFQLKENLQNVAATSCSLTQNTFVIRLFHGELTWNFGWHFVPSETIQNTRVSTKRLPPHSLTTTVDTFAAQRLSYCCHLQLCKPLNFFGKLNIYAVINKKHVLLVRVGFCTWFEKCLSLTHQWLHIGFCSWIHFWLKRLVANQEKQGTASPQGSSIRCPTCGTYQHLTEVALASSRQGRGSYGAGVDSESTHGAGAGAGRGVGIINSNRIGNETFSFYRSWY